MHMHAMMIKFCSSSSAQKTRQTTFSRASISGQVSKWYRKIYSSESFSTCSSGATSWSIWSAVTRWLWFAMCRLLPVSIARTSWHQTTCLSKKRSSSTSNKARFLLLTCIRTSTKLCRGLATTSASAETNSIIWRCRQPKFTSSHTWQKPVNRSLWRSQSAKGLRLRLTERAIGSCVHTPIWSLCLLLCYANSSSIWGASTTTRNSLNLQSRSFSHYSTCSWSFTHLCLYSPHGTNET